MIEYIVLNYLLGRNIDGIGEHVYLEVPERKSQEYIVIEKTASGRDDRINSAMIAVQSISENSLEKALEINELVKRAMDEMPDQSDDVYAVLLNSDYNFTNTRTKEYRYQAVFDLYY